nr:uncharacterized protein LOC104085132 [Nicotiana tomentosiformis]XP_009587384.1 uncharacterized protein LOC104085132 [Nicotiana tomentosiformis]XP_009587385.1 uncharacterized protein LOC104085132 [Nicotiana tomentosiformis]XP_033509034.1 uncharacterized protein LOC104085132 [Nicotiana tomentosiformis]XP_033509035.1 uncharacterized protein LOC104085132 [Nicotiana tomentosiformis]
MENDEQLYNIGCHYIDGELNVYVLHVIDEVVDTFIPAAYLCGPEITQDSSNSINKSSRTTVEGDPDNINTKEPLEEPSLEEAQVGVAVKDFFGEELDIGGVEEFIAEKDDYVLAEDEVIGGKEGVESDVDSSEYDVDKISDEGDIEIHEELRVIRNDRRNKNKASRRKKQPETVEVPIGETGIDRGFEDIGVNKQEKYTSRLGGDEEFIDSSYAGSDDTNEELDVDFKPGVDILRRRNITKIRYDSDCVVSIFELGMIFENSKVFRKAVTDYVIEYKVQLKLRPNEKHRVRVRYKHKRCIWEFFASIDRDSNDFMVNKYYHVNKCQPLNTNMLCNSKYIANKFKKS